jgi:thiamine biosynthesis protein ThiC
MLDQRDRKAILGLKAHKDLLVMTEQLDLQVMMEHPEHLDLLVMTVNRLLLLVVLQMLQH